jgi:hypothetical protein
MIQAPWKAYQLGKRAVVMLVKQLLPILSQIVGATQRGSVSEAANKKITFITADRFFDEAPIVLLTVRCGIARR